MLRYCGLQNLEVVAAGGDVCGVPPLPEVARGDPDCRDSGGLRRPVWFGMLYEGLFMFVECRTMILLHDTRYEEAHASMSLSREVSPP